MVERVESVRRTRGRELTCELASRLTSCSLKQPSNCKFHRCLLRSFPICVPVCLMTKLIRRVQSESRCTFRLRTVNNWLERGCICFKSVCERLIVGSLVDSFVLVENF